LHEFNSNSPGPDPVIDSGRQGYRSPPELPTGTIHDYNKKELSNSMKLNLPPRSFRAFLFDCDGTIADSMPLHYIAWKKALAEWGCTFDEELFYAWGGKPVTEIIATLNTMNGLKMPIEALAERKEDLYFEQLPQLKAVPEVLEIIEARHGQIPFAVVSGGRRNSVISSLTTLGLMDKFETIVGAEDYRNSKPAPDAYLIAAAHLGVAPEDCLVFEDTELGIMAATAAGMASVKVPSPLERSAERV
jgi:HAD superfamily hydrolase (TIGR01509 family)